MILLQVNKIARHFGADILFDNIQMEISSGSRVALVGRNGAGKSTLLKIIAGIDPPDEGTISKNKNISLGYLAQNTGLTSTHTVWHEMLTVFEELIAMEKRMRELEVIISSLEPEKAEYEIASKEYDRLQYEFAQKNGYSYENEIRSVLHGFHFDDTFYQKEICTLSGGQKTRLALAKMLLQKPDILILDEPTNHLDIDTLSWLENYLPSYSGALLIVSHDRYFLDKVVNEVYEISRHKMRYYKGNYSKYLELKANDLTAEWKAYEKQQTEINKLEDFVARNLARASTTKRAQSRRKILDKMERLDQPQGKEKVANFLFNVQKNSGNVVLQVEEATIGYGETSLSTPVTIDLRRQDAIAIVGPNGIGKSTLLKSIIGKIPFIKGKAFLGTNVQIGYYDQEQADLHSNKTILAELWDEHPTVAEKEIRRVLGGFLFSGQEVEKSVPLLSGGEKARLALAKLSMNQSNFLVLDEPTNHLDIDNKEVLENALITYEGSLLFVSHDRYFINRIATKVIELSETGSKLYLGDYDYYLEKKKEEEALAELLEKETVDQKRTATNTQKNDFYQTKAQQKFIRSLNRKIEAIEKELAVLYTEIHELECSMNDPKYLDNHQELLIISKELEQKKQTQETLLTEWESLSIELEEIETNPSH